MIGIVMKMDCVFCKVRTESFNTARVKMRICHGSSSYSPSFIRGRSETIPSYCALL